MKYQELIILIICGFNCNVAFNEMDKILDKTKQTKFKIRMKMYCYTQAGSLALVSEQL